ncbi:MAG: hypothetical protein AAF664_06140 [Planctomycetota bacterium]
MLLNRCLLSPSARLKADRWTLRIALVAFITHLGLIGIVDLGIVQLNQQDPLLTDPIAAIYTPFSFILVYEVYLLVFYLPRSITTYIGKQYEIITLIVIRRIFKDLANIELSSNWFENKDDLIFTADIVTSIALYFLIYVFYRLKPERAGLDSPPPKDDAMRRFIRFKESMATLLVPVVIILAIYSLLAWSISLISTDSLNSTDPGNEFKFKNINNIFFDSFFTILIIVDVLLLLVSFFHTDEFHKVIRNSGFIISTILIRLSFSVVGPVSSALIVSAVVFGIGVLFIHNCFEASHTEV